jgi:hypothetical protein
VSKHSQTRARSRTGGAPLAGLLLVGLGVLLTGLAWAILVRAAIDFGTVAARGGFRGWAFTIGASAGAVVCLVLMLALGGRALRMLGFLSDYKPRRAAPPRGRPRARRGR